MSAELIAIIAFGCIVVGLLLDDRRHADARMNGMQSRMDEMQSALGGLEERLARMGGMLAVGCRAAEPPETS